MNDDLMHGIICLADRIDSGTEAVREWFFETPLFPYGKTALELVHADRGDVVIDFLRRILRDIDRGSKPVVNPLLLGQHRRHLVMATRDMDGYSNATSKSGGQRGIGSKGLLRAQRRCVS